MARMILTLLMLLLVSSAAHAQSIWVKLCEKANVVTKDKDGGDVKNEANICLTHHERLDEKGNVLVSAALRQIEGQDKLHFMVMVPLGMMIKPGMRAIIYPHDLWQSIQTDQTLSESNEFFGMPVRPAPELAYLHPTLTASASGWTGAHVPCSHLFGAMLSALPLHRGAGSPVSRRRPVAPIWCCVTPTPHAPLTMASHISRANA